MKQSRRSFLRLGALTIASMVVAPNVLVGALTKTIPGVTEEGRRTFVARKHSGIRTELNGAVDNAFDAVSEEVAERYPAINRKLKSLVANHPLTAQVNLDERTQQGDYRTRAVRRWKRNFDVLGDLVEYAATDRKLGIRSDEFKSLAKTLWANDIGVEGQMSPSTNSLEIGVFYATRGGPQTQDVRPSALNVIYYPPLMEAAYYQRNYGIDVYNPDLDKDYVHSLAR